MSGFTTLGRLTLTLSYYNEGADVRVEKEVYVGPAMLPVEVEYLTTEGAAELRKRFLEVGTAG